MKFNLILPEWAIPCLFKMIQLARMRYFIKGILFFSIFKSLFKPWALFHQVACLCAKLLQSSLTLCDPMDCSPPGSSVRGILQARILDWLACPSPGDLPDPGIEPMVLRSPALAGRSFITSTTGEALTKRLTRQNSREFWIIFQSDLKSPWLHLPMIKNLCFNRLILLPCVLAKAQGNHICYGQ